MNVLNQRTLEFLTGTFAGGLLAGYGYVAADRLLAIFAGIALPGLTSVFGTIVVFLFAIRIGQFRVAYWESRRGEDHDPSGGTSR